MPSAPRSTAGRRNTSVAAVVLVTLLVVAAVLLVRGGSGTTTTKGAPEAGPVATAGSGRTDPSSGLPWVAESALDAQARKTLALIRSGGPFPYPRNDGVVFENREGHLPKEPSSYYHEYTVVTPGSQDRGPRRIITGSQGEKYFTADHYDSFQRIREGT